MRPRRLAGPTTTAARPAVGELTTAFPFLPYFSAGFQEYIKNPRRTDNPNTNGYAFSGEATGSLVAHCKLQGHLLQNLFGWGGQYWRAAAAAAARRPPRNCGMCNRTGNCCVQHTTRARLYHSSAKHA